MERLVDSLKRNGHICKLYMRSGKEVVGLSRIIVEIVRCILGNKACLVGTAPSFLPLFLLARNPILLIQSPVGEWSWKSRILLRLARKKRRKVMICVSEYVQDEASLNREESTLVVYAQLAAEGERNIPEMADYKIGKRIALVMMNPREFEKGYLSSIRLIERACKDFDLVVDVYGDSGEELVEIRDYCHLELHGFTVDPFSDFDSRRRGWKRIYLGMSHFEGLHMAVVEAARKGIPSILSDIPPHRELERMVAGAEMMVGSTGSEYFSYLAKMAEDDKYYEEMVKVYRQLGEEFLVRGRLGMMGLLEVVSELEG